ncbi:adhesin transport system outer membrane protein [Sinobacterium caligoides]|uniref:Adhesin transport system outer membrane protein n=1 Tax=Sinobacterium caligoides TaxID=933926 RepID=A0A3N2DMC9_9GAMM|nr:TolC family outer membrane protein [Sinobacterium caligoides]ROS00958.1 adhesin transport system outer membrane protein [Sinobacterium caligoides]
MSYSLAPKVLATLKNLGKALTIAAPCLLAMNSSQANTLEEVVYYTLVSNPEVRQHFFSYKSAVDEVNIAKGGLLPTLDLIATGGYESTNNDDRPDDLNQDRNNLTLRLVQPIWHGGENYHNIDRTTADALAERYNLIAEAEQTALKVAEAYLNVLEANENVVLAEQNLALHKVTAKLVKDKYTAGAGDRADLIQIEGRIRRAEANLTTSNNLLMNARSDYLALVGDFPINLTMPAQNINYLPSERIEAIKIAIDNNPLIKLSHYDVKAAEAQLAAQKARYYPSFDLVAEANHNYQNNGYSGRENDQRVLVEMRWNLFNGLRDRNGVSAAKSKRQTAELISNSARRQVIQQIEQSWASYVTTQKNRRSLKDYVVSAKETEQLYNEQFKVNRRTLIDLLDSQNELYASRQSYLAADFDNKKSIYRIMSALGVLLESLNINAEQSINAEVSENEQ